MKRTFQAVFGVAVCLPLVSCGTRRELVNSMGMRFRLIQPGSFTMGSDKGNADDKPLHKVTLTNAFYIAVYEVTQRQWEAVMGSNPSDFPWPNNPVERVSWDDVQEFARKLSRLGNVTYRLPTEAEWEYTCRAGTTTEFYWGDDVGLPRIGRYAWYVGNLDWRHAGPKPGGQKKPNPWGLYDMSGNLSEWCQDWYGAYPSESQTDPRGTESGSERVLRGGTWHSYADLCRSAHRGRSAPSNRFSQVGFRLVRETE